MAIWVTPGIRGSKDLKGTWKGDLPPWPLREDTGKAQLLYGKLPSRWLW